MKISEKLIDEIFKSDRETLQKIGKLVDARNSQLIENDTQKFYPGDKVQFESRKNETVRGTVKKVNRKTIQVVDNSSKSLWNVSPKFLSFI